MKNVLEIVIHGDRLTISYPFAEVETEFVSDKESSLGDHLTLFCQQNGITPSRVVFFVSEELLFFKSFRLPLKTPDLKSAISFQISQLTPFDSDGMLYTYTTKTLDTEYQVNLYATNNPIIQSYLQQVADAGYNIVGLYPESQRYVATTKKKRWVLVVPGRLSKILIFRGNRLEDRKLRSTVPSYSELAESYDTETIYHLDPPDGSSFLEVGRLADRKPILKDYNMLPPEFRRPDFFKIAIIALIILNTIGLFTIAGLKEIRLQSEIKRLDNKIAQILPEVQEVNTLRGKRNQLSQAIGGFENFENIDLFRLLAQLTNEMPLDSHLEQIRMEKGQKAIRLLGYTENIGDLTEKLQNVGDTKLKSTTRRKNKTYFHMETSLP